jgi:WD40 repeat protein
MGCGSSNEVSAPGSADAWDDDADFDERRPRRDRQLKVCSGVDDGGKDDDGRDDDYMEYDEDDKPVHGFSGQIAEPDEHNDINRSKPDASLDLEYVYGYRAIDSRQNIKFDKSGNVCYFTAALGIALDTKANTQTYFGGGEVDCTAKNVARDTRHHTDDIMSIDICSHKEKCVTGQVGSSPAMFVWGTADAQKYSRIKLTKGSRGIAAVAFREDNMEIACVDLHNEHHVYVFTFQGESVMKANGDTNRIKDVAWSGKPGSTKFATAGTKHIYFWDSKDPSFKKRGIFSGKPMTSFSSIVWDSDEFAYTGGANGGVYKWGTDRQCDSVVQAHKKGYYVSALALVGGKLYSGGKDKKVVTIDPSSMNVLTSVDTESMPRAIDVMGDSMVVGMRNGTIQVDGRAVMHSHSDGEVWGLDYIEGQGPVTSADDNKVMFWDENKRACTKTVRVSDRKVNAKRGGASTMADNYDSQQSRAVAVHGDKLAIATNDGALVIRSASSADMSDADKIITDSAEWIECMAFNPDGTRLAVGSHDDKVRVYDTSDLSLVGTCKGHSSYICALDWSADGTYIRTNSGDYELLFWTAADCEQDKNGTSNTTST